MFPFDLNNLVFLRNRQIAWYGGQNLPDSPKNTENSDFSGYYCDWKTGKLGLKAMSGKGFFQQSVTEEMIVNKGFAKKEV